MNFHKVLSPYYHKWFRDCHDSAVYLESKGDIAGAQDYLDSAKEYLEIILDNYDAIEFFRIDQNAHKIDKALPEQFRGYN